MAKSAITVLTDEEAPDEPEPPQLIDAENLDPATGIDLTDEQRVLMNATMDADDHGDSVDVLETLSRIQLHGKLATAQLRARTQKLEQGMSDEEREQVWLKIWMSSFHATTI